MQFLNKLLCTKTRRFFAALALVLMVGGATAVATAPAAYAAGEGCGSIHVCVYNNGTLSGIPMYYWTSPTYNTCIPFGAAINDKTKSIKQSAGWSATLYTNAGCSGSIIATVSGELAGESMRSCNGSYGPWANSSCAYPKASSIWYVA